MQSYTFEVLPDNSLPIANNSSLNYRISHLEQVFWDMWFHWWLVCMAI